MTATDYLEQAFGPGGPLARALAEYVPRPGQIALARAVDAAIRDAVHLVAEGPTGTGKSLAYAVPLEHHAATDRRRAVIVTANIALQEQLVRKDLPLLAAAFDSTVGFALLKGRSNYLCRDRFAAEEAQGSLLLADDHDLGEQQRLIGDWAHTTRTGDVSELPFEPPPRLWRRFSVLAEDCKGADCRFHDECHAVRARAAAARADIVVTNYHLLFAHLEVREETGEDLVLPPFDVAVLDEAHKAADIARDFLGFRLTAGAVRWAARHLATVAHAPLARRLEAAAEIFFGHLRAHRDSPDYRTRLRHEEVVPWAGLHEVLVEAARAYASASEAAADAETHGELGRAARRAATLARQLTEGMTLADAGAVYYIDQDGYGRAALCAKPVEVAGRLRRTLFDRARSVIVTSATLSTAGSFEYVARELGVDEPREIIAATPFRFAEQALLVVPEDLPEPNDPAFPDAVAEAVAEIVEQARGRTLALFTSYRNLNLAAERLAGGRHRVLRQGERPRSALIEEFRRDVGSVLLGTESFWGGVDVPGEALSCLVIDRLPFSSPDDPLLDAIAARDPAAFRNHSLPRAVIAFKQGFGRLVRRTTDRGVAVVLDRRLLTRRYGRIFLDSLPEMPSSRSLHAIAAFLGPGA